MAAILDIWSTTKNKNFTVSEWVIIVQWQHSNFSAISWREKVNVNFQWDNDEVLFVLDQYA